MRFIDFHTHIYPESIAEKATENVSTFYGLHADAVGTDHRLLEEQKKADITNFVILPVATKPEQVHHINEFVVKEVAEHSEFYGFATLFAGMENPMEELEYIEKKGLKGIKLHPDCQQFPMDDERLFPVYDRIQGKLPVLFHCGDRRLDYSNPKRLKRVLDMFPRLQVIAAHLGGWSQFDEALSVLKNEDCYLDISSCMGYMSDEKFLYYVKSYGADRLLFGSDFPLQCPSKEAEHFMKLDLTDEEKEKIAYKNALKILS
ncbi:MAG: amidohydrolase family protein [Oscillospiraceae bacterium]